jgi:alkanesulfonate monooxygenase
MRSWLAGDIRDVRATVLEPNLWGGLKLVRPGVPTALVGSPASIARKLEQYIQAGVTLFILSGYPQDEAAEWVGKHVIPQVAVDPTMASARVLA